MLKYPEVLDPFSVSYLLHGGDEGEVVGGLPPRQVPPGAHPPFLVLPARVPCRMDELVKLLIFTDMLKLFI